ncbi:SDR family NAD(P)-dependent oxidoreductase [Caulobacter sp. BK020]|uniref:SDR family NAD(P)-dependent oxidoreductase n=1 Tax=Caulobacter sp. BK020 TaxID=2512117 RepID=UPI0010537DE4|nr:SDR family NAD(P)-dependent oxidoreductase [Caulobacter sp. BK020]TCS08133.1 NAD(P)-dependent dehydrogenase (short-subunit alcohol dehydrogenase family) [Caulobacter sp. BK020]
MSSALDLTGRIALVTGASSGLGARFARMLAAQGVKVVAGARRLDRLEALAEAIRADGGQVEPVEMDVEDEASIKAAYDRAEATFGTPDIVIANAGVNAQGPATELPADDLGQLLRINVQGVYLTAREGARRLIASPDASRGRIILLGSVGSLRPLAGLTAYSASKAGVAMLGKGLAREWARYGINVNTICPGWIVTELNAEWLAGEGGQKLIKTFPRRRVMTPDHLDGLVSFLGSDASSAITGGVFAADDGQSLA